MKTVESKDTRDGLAEKVTDEEEKKLKKIRQRL